MFGVIIDGSWFEEITAEGEIAHIGTYVKGMVKYRRIVCNAATDKKYILHSVGHIVGFYEEGLLEAAEFKLVQDQPMHCGPGFHKWHVNHSMKDSTGKSKDWNGGWNPDKFFRVCSEKEFHQITYDYLHDSTIISIIFDFLYYFR
eukprot:UN02968